MGTDNANADGLSQANYLAIGLMEKPSKDLGGLVVLVLVLYGRSLLNL